MALKVKIVLLNMSPSEILEANIAKHAEKLYGMHPALTECAATVDMQSHRAQGNEYAVRLELHAAGEGYVVSRVENQDAYVAIRDAFDAAHKQLTAAKREPRRDSSQREVG
ncbi:MAG TPA: HPF/RaiA family ribosome-associated protein [Burkholderiales bacterium]|nr:HPF/RaiA family ribosome-associated protein [Burkholderiales bacterium]